MANENLVTKADLETGLGGLKEELLERSERLIALEERVSDIEGKSRT